MNIVIHHNEACGTSRNVLKILQDSGHQITVIDYLAEGWSRPQLLALFAAAGLTPRSALRENQWDEARFGALDAADDAALLEAMLAAPILVNRPIVCCANGTRLCRPSESVHELLGG